MTTLVLSFLHVYFSIVTNHICIGRTYTNTTSTPSRPTKINYSAQKEIILCFMYVKFTTKQKAQTSKDVRLFKLNSRTKCSSFTVSKYFPCDGGTQNGGHRTRQRKDSRGQRRANVRRQREQR